MENKAGYTVRNAGNAVSEVWIVQIIDPTNCSKSSFECGPDELNRLFGDPDKRKNILGTVRKDQDFDLGVK